MNDVQKNRLGALFPPVSHFQFLQNHQCCIRFSLFSKLFYHIPYVQGAVDKYCALLNRELWF